MPYVPLSLPDHVPEPVVPEVIRSVGDVALRGRVARARRKPCLERSYRPGDAGGDGHCWTAAILPSSYGAHATARQAIAGALG
jgi:hypothetical protein